MSIIIRCKLFYVTLSLILTWDSVEDGLCSLISLQNQLNRPQSPNLIQ